MPMPAQIVWQQPDAAYRFAKLDVTIGETVFTPTSPVNVKELSVDVNANASLLMFTLVMFDPTFVTLSALLGLNVYTSDERRIRLAFGWDFDGGYIDDLNGSILSVKYAIGTEGVEYTLRGKIEARQQAPQEYWGLPEGFSHIKISDLVQHIATYYYGMKSDAVIVEETTDEPADWKVPIETTSILAFLRHLAEKATEVMIPPEAGTEDKFTATFDMRGQLHFHTFAYGVTDLVEPKVVIDWPYPKLDAPVIDFGVADVTWTDVTLAGAMMDPITGEQVLAQGSLAEEKEKVTEVIPLAEEGICTAKYPEYDAFIEEASKVFNVSVALINSIIRQETRCRPNAISPANAKGLMQIMPGTASGYAPKAQKAAKDAGVPYEDITAANIMDPRTNIFIGTSYLNFGINHIAPCDDIEVIAAGYNRGYGASDIMACKLPPETRISPWGYKAEAERIAVANGDIAANWRTYKNKVPQSKVHPHSIGESYNYGKSVGKFYEEYARGQEVTENLSSGNVGRRFELEVSIAAAPMSKQKFFESVDRITQTMAVRSMYGDLTLMGNPYIEFGDILEINIRPPIGDYKDNLITHLSGEWWVRQVVHHLTEGGFTTNVNVVRYWSENVRTKQNTEGQTATN